jgi:hypothetical protein
MTKRMKTSARGRRVYRRLFGCAAPRMLRRARRGSDALRHRAQRARAARKAACVHGPSGLGRAFARLAQAIEHEVDSIEEWMTPFQRAAGYA